MNQRNNVAGSINLRQSYADNASSAFPQEAGDHPYPPQIVTDVGDRDESSLMKRRKQGTASPGQPPKIVKEFEKQRRVRRKEAEDPNVFWKAQRPQDGD